MICKLWDDDIVFGDFYGLIISPFWYIYISPVVFSNALTVEFAYGHGSRGMALGFEMIGYWA